jgi:hypothetical protein
LGALRLEPRGFALGMQRVALGPNLGKPPVYPFGILDQRQADLTLIVCGTGGNDRSSLEATPR